MTSESGHRLFDECVPPPTRKVSARLTVTYAGFEGESELLEGLYKRGLAAPEVAPDLRAGDGILMYWTHRRVRSVANECVARSDAAVTPAQSVFENDRKPMGHD